MKPVIEWFIKQHFVLQGIVGIFILPLIMFYLLGKVTQNYAELFLMWLDGAEW